MASSEIQICNLAISRVGDELITSFDDGTTASDLCALHYEPARDAVLEDHLWSFALERASLARLTDAPVNKYAYKYQLPPDHIRTIITDLDEYSIPWTREGNTILTDEEAVYLVYIKQVTDVTQFSALFVQALSLFIASRIAYPITNKSRMAMEILNEYDLLFDKAVTSDGQQTPDLLDEVDATTLIEVR